MARPSLAMTKGGRLVGLTLPSLLEWIAPRPEVLEPRVGVHAAHDLRHPGRGLIEPRAPGAEARDHGHVEIEHRQRVAEEVAPGRDLRVHVGPARGDAVMHSGDHPRRVLLAGGDAHGIALDPE